MAIRRLLVANRGEIACRVFRTCDRLGIETAAVAAPDDRGSLHARSADAVVEIASYLDPAEHVRAARERGRRRRPPGLRVPRRERRSRRGRVESRARMDRPAARGASPGRRQARRQANRRRAGVPTLAAGEPAEIGYPLLVKAAAGGGGRGMRVVRSAGGARRRARCAHARSGGGVRRRHRLLRALPRAPSPCRGAAAGRRRTARCSRSASATARSSAGTRRWSRSHRRPRSTTAARQRSPTPPSAFALGDRLPRRRHGRVPRRGDEFRSSSSTPGSRSSTRSPRAVTGLDLVEWQLRIAEGEPLATDRRRKALVGHAVEARLYAEDPVPSCRRAAGSSGSGCPRASASTQGSRRVTRSGWRTTR